MNPYAPPTATSSRAQAGAEVPVAGLEGRVFVRERSVLGRPGFIVDGAFRRSVRGVVEVADASGRVHRFRLRGLPLDPCPRVEVDGALIDVFPRLPVWVSALCMLPLVLVFEGGAVGGVLGIFATYANFRIARSRGPALLQIGFGAMTAFVAYLVLLAVRVLILRLMR